MGRLTLDSVARQAGLSKAGLLHHVASKDVLIRAMVQRHCEQWLEQFRAKHGELKARGCLAPAIATFMETCMSGSHAWNDADRARNRVMVAALVHDERQVEPLRRVMREIDALVAMDRLPPGVGDAIHLAVHGLWFQWIFAMGDVSDARLGRVREALDHWAKSPHAAPIAVKSVKIAKAVKAKTIGRAKSVTQRPAAASKGPKAKGSKAGSTGARRVRVVKGQGVE